jgi:hypothetical protein
MENKKFEDLGIEYILSIQGLVTRVYSPKCQGLEINKVKNFGHLQYLGVVDTNKLEQINNGLVVSADSAGLCAILKKNRRFDKANAFLDLNNNNIPQSKQKELYVLQFYKIDFDKNN